MLVSYLSSTQMETSVDVLLHSRPRCPARVSVGGGNRGSQQHIKAWKSCHNALARARAFSPIPTIDRWYSLAMTRLSIFSSFLILSSLCSAAVLPNERDWNTQSTFSATNRKDAKVLILGGGMAGITAARTLHDKGVTNFIVVEARNELGGRMMSYRLGAPGRKHTVELGANWVQGTQTGDGPENPIWRLAKKHGLRTQRSSYFDGLSRSSGLESGRREANGFFIATYDETGEFDFLDVFEKSVKNFELLIASAGRYQ